MPDLGLAPREKVFTYAAASRFIIVLDFSPSGHLNEIELLKDLGRPIAVIGLATAPSTFMLHGLERITFIKRFDIDEETPLAVAAEHAIDWAEETRKRHIENNISALPWMSEVLTS